MQVDQAESGKAVSPLIASIQQKLMSPTEESGGKVKVRERQGKLVYCKCDFLSKTLFGTFLHYVDFKN